MEATLRDTQSYEALQEQVFSFVVGFGLHRPDETACGMPVSVSEAYTLVELAHGTPLRQSDLADRLRLDKSTVSRLVRQLDRRGWIERRTDPADARAVQLTLSHAGRTAAARLAAARRAKFTRVLGAIPEDERDGVMRAMNVLVEALDERE